MAWDDTAEQRRIRRRRRRKIRGPLTLVVLVALVSGAAWYGYQSVMRAVPGAGPTEVCNSPSPGVKQRITAARVTVNVLNAGRVSGLADRTAEQLRQRGFTVDTVGNDRESKVARVEVRGRASNAPEVLLVAANLTKPTVRSDNRDDVSVDIILGSEFHGLASRGPTAMDVDTPIPVCVDPRATETPSID